MTATALLAPMSALWRRPAPAAPATAWAGVTDARAPLATAPALPAAPLTAAPAAGGGGGGGAPPGGRGGIWARMESHTLLWAPGGGSTDWPDRRRSRST